MMYAIFHRDGRQVTRVCGWKEAWSLLAELNLTRWYEVRRVR